MVPDKVQVCRTIIIIVNGSVVPMIDYNGKFLYFRPEGLIFLAGIFLLPVNCTVITRGILVVRGY